MIQNKELVIKKELQGDFGVWLVIYVELFTFGVIFSGYVLARFYDVETFNESQLLLKNKKTQTTLI